MRKNLYTILLLAMFLPAAALGQLENQTPGTTGADFLKISVGARQAAMGGAFGGVADDATAIYWNPGGLGYADRWNITMAGNRWLFDTWHGSFFAARHFCFLGQQRTALGLGVIGLGMPDWNSTEDPNARKGKANDLALIGSVAQRIDWLTRHLSLGLSGKYIQRTLMDESADGLGLDGGVMLRAGGFKAGMTVTNYTLKKIKFIEDAFKLPTTLRGGLSFNLPTRGLLLAADASKPIDNEIKIHLGAEKWITDGLALRVGYKAKTGDGNDIGANNFSGFTAGLGFRWKMWQFDYAFSNYDEVANDWLNSTHQLSLSLQAPNDLDPFGLKSPPKIVYCSSDHFDLKWERTYEHDRDRPAKYFVVMDNEAQSVENAIERFETTPNLDQFRKWMPGQAPLLFKEQENPWIRLPKRSDLSGPSPRWYVQLDEKNLEIRSGDTFYWTVLAFEEETGLRRVCKQRVGRFTFRPDELRDFKLKSPKNNKIKKIWKDELVFKWTKTRLRKGKGLAHYILLCGSDREHIEAALKKFEGPIWVKEFKAWLEEEAQVEFYEEFESVGKGKMSYPLPITQQTRYDEGKEIVEWVVQNEGKEWLLIDGQPIYWSVLAYEEVCGTKKICKERVRRTFIDFQPDPTFRAY